jgi:hypothetical protein
MNLLPKEFAPLILMFAPLFSKRVWEGAVVLLVGAILAPGERTVSAILRVMGKEQERQFQRYHRVLNRAIWSSRQASRLLLEQLVSAFAPSGVLVMGIDDTIERRRGQQIGAKGIYRDPVRSSHSHFVKTSGLRWLSLMLLVEIPWAQRVWALPFLTALTPSQRYHQRQGQRHKTLVDWSRQMLKQVRRWLPERFIVLVGDSTFATLELLHAACQLPLPIHVVTRLRLDAALYHPAPQRQAKQLGRPRKVGQRLPALQELVGNPYTPWETMVLKDWYGQGNYTLQIASCTAVWYHTGLPPVPIRWVLIQDPQAHFPTQALLCTDLTAHPQQILQWFRWRWQVEVTFEEVRTHLGVETQRQWSPLAILRTTPALLALFSIVVLLAHQAQSLQPFQLPRTAWYDKPLPTFSDALALVRQRFWYVRLFQLSTPQTDTVNIPRSLFNCWSHLLCFAA